MELAATRHLPAAIHCLKAWGALWDYLRSHPTPEPASCCTPMEVPRRWSRALSSTAPTSPFPPTSPRTQGRAREVFRQIPLARLLVETDAPDMSPPAERNAHPLADPATGQPINHRHIEVAYAAWPSSVGSRSRSLRKSWRKTSSGFTGRLNFSSIV